MKRIVILAAILAVGGIGLGAQVPPGAALAPGTEITAELRSSLDTAHARRGMRVQAVTTADVKVHGKKVLPRGTKLFGAVLAVTPAESPRSPAHLTVLFTQARTKKGQVLPLQAVITSVHRLAPPQAPMPMAQPVLPDMQNPEEPDMGRPERPTLGSEPLPPQMSQPNHRMDALVISSHQAPIRIRVEAGKDSVLSSRGNFNLSPGTRLKLQELKIAAGAPSGAGSR